MTEAEIIEHYQIPLEIIQEYEILKSYHATSYNEQDISYLSMLVTLHSIGFQQEEAMTYMRLLLEGEKTKLQRLQMLNQKREEKLKKIHEQEAQLDQLDYLRFQTKTN